MLCCLCPLGAALLQECLEAPLLAALDAESDPGTSTQIRGTLLALLAASAPTQPGYWLRLLGGVALAAPPGVVAAAPAGQQGGAAAAAGEGGWCV